MERQFGDSPRVRTGTGIIVAALMCALFSCVKRKFNSDALPETLYQAGKPRIAIDYLGIGWCFYAEDQGVRPEIIKSQETERDGDFNIDTGIVTTHTYQVYYALRKFKKVHPVSLDFGILSEYSSRKFQNSSVSGEQFEAIEKLHKEVDLARGRLSGRRMDLSICEMIRKDNRLPKTGELQNTRKEAKGLSEYIVRCSGNEGEVLGRSDIGVVSVSEFKMISDVLSEVTTGPAFSGFRREGAKCKDEIVQLEVFRGPVISTSSEKISN
ncbi:MAG: hypothetical protein EBR09_13065 [Proteobacteria bacterium]|nr:hypothetical protein [Pseudomonadota bacterium]